MFSMSTAACERFVSRRNESFNSFAVVTFKLWNLVLEPTT
jgi:hypothetical protein